MYRKPKTLPLYPAPNIPRDYPFLMNFLYFTPIHFIGDIGLNGSEFLPLVLVNGGLSCSEKADTWPGRLVASEVVWSSQFTVFFGAGGSSGVGISAITP